jgi:hypothetical protein
MFKIQFAELPKSLKSKNALGRIDIDDFYEHFKIPLTYWKVEQYWKQWQSALESFVNGAEQSSLIHQMLDPEKRPFIFCWTFYRVGGKVYIHENLLNPDNYQEIFKIEDINHIVGKRKTITEDGSKISEWETKIDDIKLFLNEIENYKDFSYSGYKRKSKIKKENTKIKESVK